jgi:ferredoxin
VRLTLDTAACMGHGRCYSLAPELFDADDDGHAVLLSADVASEHETAARDAEQCCPEQAIGRQGAGNEC